MTEQAPTPVPARDRTRFFIIAGIVALAIVGVVVWLVTGGSSGPAAAGPATIIPLPGHQVCADQVRINVDTDARMTQIADAVRNDPQVRVVYTQTQQQAFEQYKQEFADQPDLLALARPGVLPALVLVVPVAGTDAHQFADTLRTEFADAKDVRPLTQADSAKAPASEGETAPATPCPASGEFPPH